MRTSNITLNGWPGIKTLAARKTLLRTIAIPGTNRRMTVRRSVAPIMAAFAADWDRLMPARLKLDGGDPIAIGGHNYRPARSGAGLSNHAGGVAMDFRTNVLKADGKPHMTRHELAVLDRLLSMYVTKDGHRIFGSGAYYRATDEMHIQLADSWENPGKGPMRRTTQADVDQVTKTMNIDKNGNRKLFTATH